MASTVTTNAAIDNPTSRRVEHTMAKTPEL
jgi:hypothetical protein